MIRSSLFILFVFVPLELMNRASAQNSPDKSGQEAVSNADQDRSTDPQIKIFALHNLGATQAEEIVKQLFGSEVASISSNQRSNQLIVRAEPKVLNEIEAVVLKLDEPVQEESPPRSKRFDNVDEQKLMGKAKISKYKIGYRLNEQRLAELAGEIRKRSKENSKDPELDVLRKELRKQVANAFAIRQALQAAELAALKQRIRTIEESFAARNQIREEIIDRRIKDLLNPNREWDAEKTARTLPKLQGVILQISPTNQFVAISLGSDDGLRKGDKLEVYTAKTYLGRIEVIEMTKDQSVARILQEKPGWPMRPGDQITTHLDDKPDPQPPRVGFQGTATGMEQKQTLSALTQIGGGNSSRLPPGDGTKAMSLQVKIDEPTGATLIWDSAQNGKTLPTRIIAKTGETIDFFLTQSSKKGGGLFGSIEFSAAHKSTEVFLHHNAIPVTFTEEDFDQGSSGNLVTKVIYLPDPKYAELAIGGVETLVTTRLDPGVDPITEADRRGTIVAVIRLGNRVLDPGTRSR